MHWVERVFGFIVQMKKNCKSLIKFEVIISENIKDNVSKCGTAYVLSKLYLRSQNVSVFL